MSADSADVLATVHKHLAAFNARDVEAVVATFAEDAVFTAGSQMVVGARGLRVLFADSFAAPADATLELRRAVVADDTAACELVEIITIAESVHELEVAAFYTVREGLLARVRVYRAGED